MLFVRQLGADDLASPVTVLLAALAVLPLALGLVLSARLRGARAEVISWLAEQPFPVQNLNALLVGLTDDFEIEFESGTMPSISREAMQKLLDPVSDDILATAANAEARTAEVRIGVIDSHRLPLRTTYLRWARFQRIVKEVLIPLHRERPIAAIRILLA